MKVDKALSMISLAKKAGKLQSGEFCCEKAIKSFTAYLIIVATDASERTKKDFTNACEFYDTPIRFYGTKESLGQAIGCEQRASLVILDENFSKSILEKIDLNSVTEE